MAVFTTESNVRLKFQINDSALVSSQLVEAAIHDAHDQVLRHLDPAFDTPDPAETLVLGETLLAGAHLFRALAARDALEQKRIAIGGQRIEEGGRFAALNAVADLAEDHAWFFLDAFLLARPLRPPLTATPSRPVLGEA